MIEQENNIRTRLRKINKIINQIFNLIENLYIFCFPRRNFNSN